MGQLTLEPTLQRKERVGDALIVVGTLGLFGGLLLEQPYVMLAGLILFVVGLVVSKSKLKRSIALQRSDAQARAAAFAAAPTRPSIARLALGLVGGVAAFLFNFYLFR